MKKIICLAAVAAIVAGCQTRITAEKHAEVPNPIQQVVTVNGQEQVITTGYMVTSGGWYATARSPLYAAEALSGLEIGVHTNGSVTLSIDKYDRDLSTNAVAMVGGMFDGGVKLVTAIGEAYAKIAGGAAGDAVVSVARKAYEAFTAGGGDVAKAAVSTVGDKVTVSDGEVCTTCTPDGTCTTGACAE